MDERKVASGTHQSQMRKPQQIVIAAAVLLGMLVLYIHSRYYYPFICDDAFISLRYSERLVEGYGLTWTEGQPVEGYSNLLWVLLCSLFGGLGMEWVAAARLVAYIGLLGVLAGIGIGWRRMDGQSPVALISGILFCALAGPAAVWAVAGLEQPLLAGCVAGAIASAIPLLNASTQSWKYALWAGVWLGLAAITRPDGVLFAGAVGAAVLFAQGIRRTNIRNLAVMTATTTTFFAGQLLFRLAYYGEWVPNTALAKLSISETHTQGGWEYLSQGLLWMLPLSGIALGFGIWLLLRKDSRKKALLFLLPVFIYAPYIVIIGGDIFPGRRHILPIIIPLAFLWMLGCDKILQKQLSAGVKWGLTGLIAVLMIVYSLLQFEDPENDRALYETWEWDAKKIGLALKEGFGERKPLLAVDAAGALPFYSDLPCIDMLGLNDYYLPRHKPEGFGKGFIGHELGDGEYILRNEPDLVWFGYPPGFVLPQHLSGKQMIKNPSFYHDYTYSRFLIQEKPFIWAGFWIRRTSPKIGVESTADKVKIPAWLLAAGNETLIRLSDEGKFYVKLAPGEPVGTKFIQASGGEWLFSLAGSESQQGKISLLFHNEAFATGAVQDTFVVPDSLSNGFDIVMEAAPGTPAQKVHALGMRKIR